MKQRPDGLKKKVQLLDGNWSFYPVAYCTHHGGYLTQGLVDTHRCDKRQCSRYKVIEHEKSLYSPS